MSAVKRSLNVAVVGLGALGVPLGRNLAVKGRGSLYLQLYAQSLERARKVADDFSVDGVTCAMRVHNRLNTVTKWSDVILSTLNDVDESRRVLLEDQEALIRHARPGQIIVDHTTVDLETSKECEFEAARRGAFFLDAPVSGSARIAFNGQLTIMVGGPDEAYQRVAPLLRLCGEQVHRMGPSGSGSATKGISQVLTAVHAAAAAEAMKLAHNLGIENNRTLNTVLDSTWGSSTMLRRSAPALEVLLRNTGEATAMQSSNANVNQLITDIGLVGSGCPLPLESFPLLQSTLRMLERASASNDGDKDLSVLVQYMEAASSEAAAAAGTQSEGDRQHAFDASMSPGGPDAEGVEFY